MASEEDINISRTDVDPMAEQADRSQGSSTAMGGFGAVRDHLRRNQAEKGEEGVEGSRLVVSNGQNSHRSSGGERQPALGRAAAGVGLASFDRSLVSDLAPSGSNGQITISRISTLGSYLPEEAELIKDGGSRNLTSLPETTFFKRKDETS
ncbi:hypothetical protein GQ457_08G018470 [Hibiscus cannabinus]